VGLPSSEAFHIDSLPLLRRDVKHYKNTDFVKV
jgi:hypothetical protein